MDCLRLCPNFPGFSTVDFLLEKLPFLNTVCLLRSISYCSVYYCCNQIMMFCLSMRLSFSLPISLPYSFLRKCECSVQLCFIIAYFESMECRKVVINAGKQANKQAGCVSRLLGAENISHNDSSEKSNNNNIQKHNVVVNELAALLSFFALITFEFAP